MKQMLITTYYVLLGILSIVSNVFVLVAGLIFILLLAATVLPVAFLWIVLEIFKLVIKGNES